MTDSDSETIMQEYAHSCRIVEEEREGDYNQYHYEGPMGRINTFENPDKARLYADVHRSRAASERRRLANVAHHLPSHNPVRTC